MRAFIAVQTAFCFLVLFAASHFVATFQRLSNSATRFSADRLLTLDTVTQKSSNLAGRRCTSSLPAPAGSRLQSSDRLQVKRADATPGSS